MNGLQSSEVVHAVSGSYLVLLLIGSHVYLYVNMDIE